MTNDDFNIQKIDTTTVFALSSRNRLSIITTPKRQVRITGRKRYQLDCKIKPLPICSYTCVITDEAEHSRTMIPQRGGFGLLASTNYIG